MTPANHIAALAAVIAGAYATHLWWPEISRSLRNDFLIERRDAAPDEGLAKHAE